MASFQKILIIQTAYIGDVVLATVLLEKLHQFFPKAQLDFLLRKGNEGLLEAHPFVSRILTWDKKNRKYSNLYSLAKQVRQAKYDLVVNLQRFLSAGLLLAFSGAKERACFDKNPLSFFATNKLPHRINPDGNPVHEVERNLSLVSKWTDNQFVRPKLYPKSIVVHDLVGVQKFVTISPASVWFTKQLPKEKWLELMAGVGENTTICLLGGKSDAPLCEALKQASQHPRVTNLAGKLSFLESAALMKSAIMNFVNDSAPLHFASAVNAPVTAIFCSTIPAFGFGPLSDNSSIVETTQNLACRPCGLHGKNACPEGHFKCAEIEVRQLLAKIK